MKFLFETMAFSYDYPVFYRILEISSEEYLADPVEAGYKSFSLRKRSGQWIAEGNFTHHHAEQIGKQIEKRLSGK